MHARFSSDWLYVIKLIVILQAIYTNNNQDRLYISRHLKFGLGCTTLVTSKETHCYIKLKLKPPDSSLACYLNGNTETDDPAICDILIPVWTRFGLEQAGSTRCDRLPTDMAIDGLTFHDSYYILFMRHQVNDMGEELRRTKIHIQNTKFIGQQLFDTYNIPPLEVCKKLKIYLVSNYGSYNNVWSFSNLDKKSNLKM